MPTRVAGKRALIYGGGSGIGLACAAALAGEGARVFLSGRREAVLRAAAQSFAASAAVGFLAGDATKVTDVERVTAAAAASMGGIDTIVISAGMGAHTPLTDISADEFQTIVDSNLRPVFLAVRLGLPHLLAARQASVIAISSMYGLVGQKDRVAYCASKFGVVGMVKAMALDLADKGVRVNAICPGFVETPLAREVARVEGDAEAVLDAKRRMHPIPRGAQPGEIGELAVYLASDLSAFMTGQALPLDGGFTAR